MYHSLPTSKIKHFIAFVLTNQGYCFLKIKEMPIFSKETSYNFDNDGLEQSPVTGYATS